MYIMHIISTPTTPLLQPEQTGQTSETETVIQLTPLDSSFTQWRDWERRALGSGEANATTTENVTVVSFTSSSASPFFTSGGAVEGSNSDNSSGITKIALEWVFAIAAFIAIAAATMCRYAQIRRKNQPLRSFIPTPNLSSSNFRNDVSELNATGQRRSLPRTTGLPSINAQDSYSQARPLSASASLFYPPSLAHGRYPVVLEPLPAHLADSLGTIRRSSRGRNSSRAARGADIDEHGRRGGGRDPDDTDDDDDKEYDLPAYESVQGGGPPRYADGNESIQMVDGIPMRVIPLQVIVSESQATNNMATIEEESPPQQNVDVIARQEQPTVQNAAPPEYCPSSETHRTTTNSDAPPSTETRSAAGTADSATIGPSPINNHS